MTVQAERAAAEITRKLEKQEKKHLKETAGCNCPPSSCVEKEYKERCWDLAESAESWLEHTLVPWAQLPPRRLGPQ